MLRSEDSKMLSEDSKMLSEDSILQGEDALRSRKVSLGEKARRADMIIA